MSDDSKFQLALDSTVFCEQTTEMTAYHEAGHAVIGRVLTLLCGGATIKPDFDDHSAGNSITADPYERIFEWEDAARCATPGPTAWCLCEWPA